MPIGTCDSCDRFYVTSQRDADRTPCPACSRRLRPTDVTELRSRRPGWKGGESNGRSPPEPKKDEPD